MACELAGADMSEPSNALPQSGALFHGRYRVVRRIKAGAMGAVYEVVDETTNSTRAMKVMLPEVVEDPDLRARFALEAKITGGIESDHIVRVSDAGIDAAAGTPFLVMDLLRGEELGAMVKRRGPLPPAEVVTYLFQVALALEKTHAAGIVHRDLKPENLFVTTRDDGTPCVKILDFGIAKMVAQRTQAQATRAIGTPLYMSPEQLRGDGAIGPRADLYAVGHIAYALLVGEPYWMEEGSGAEAIFALLTKVIRGAEEAPSARAARRRGVTLPPAFDAWFQRATAVEPELRFEQVRVAVAALGDALDVPTARAPTPSWSGTVPWVPPVGWPGSASAQSGDGGARMSGGAQQGGTSSMGAAVLADRGERRPGGARRSAAVGLVGLVVLASAGALAWRAVSTAETTPAAPPPVEIAASTALPVDMPTAAPDPLPGAPQPEISAAVASASAPPASTALPRTQPTSVPAAPPAAPKRSSTDSPSSSPAQPKSTAPPSSTRRTIF